MFEPFEWRLHMCTIINNHLHTRLHAVPSLHNISHGRENCTIQSWPLQLERRVNNTRVSVSIWGDSHSLHHRQKNYPIHHGSSSRTMTAEQDRATRPGAIRGHTRNQNDFRKGGMVWFPVRIWRTPHRPGHAVRANVWWLPNPAWGYLDSYHITLHWSSLRSPCLWGKMV